MSSSIDSFYQQIRGFARFDQFAQLHGYQPLHPDWQVVVADVQGSTAAIAEGRYKQVNSLGVASIVALLNAARPIKIPYAFGGDGAIGCFPPAMKGKIESALVATKQMAADNLGLNLRVGIVPVSDILDAGHQVLIGKFQPGGFFEHAVFLGDGLSFAEARIKDPDPANPYLLDEQRIEPHADFAGFECRWNQVPSPHQETIALLVHAQSGDAQDAGELYARIMRDIIVIYGDAEQHHPLRLSNLSLTGSSTKLQAEVAVRSASMSPMRRKLYALKLKILIAMGRWFMAAKIHAAGVDWGQYKPDLIANSNYRQCDELLRMVISGSKSQRRELRQLLEQYRRDGRIVYGIHASPGALITCMISNHQKDHVHFVDGSAGGYALASVELKQQLASKK